MTSALDERYGTSRSRRRSHWWGGIVAGVLVVLVIAFWALTTYGPNATLSANYDVVNFAVADDGASVDVDYMVTVDPSTHVACAIEATSKQSAVVGWVVVDLPPTETATRGGTELISTVQEASTVVVKECWIP